MVAREEAEGGLLGGLLGVVLCCCQGTLELQPLVSAWREQQQHSDHQP